MGSAGRTAPASARWSGRPPAGAVASIRHPIRTTAAHATSAARGPHTGRRSAPAAYAGSPAMPVMPSAVSGAAPTVGSAATVTVADPTSAVPPRGACGAAARSGSNRLTPARSTRTTPVSSAIRPVTATIGRPRPMAPSAATGESAAMGSAARPPSAATASNAPTSTARTSAKSRANRSKRRARNPANHCEVCEPESNRFDWTLVDDQTTCGGVSGRVCCNGECCSPTECCGTTSCEECGPHCRIGGADIDEGTVNPADPCEVCKPDDSFTDWTHRGRRYRVRRGSGLLRRPVLPGRSVLQRRSVRRVPL